MPRTSTLTKPSHELSLFDALSHLNFLRAAKLLGPEGGRLITEGGKYEIDVPTQVNFDRERFRLQIDSATVTLTLSPAARDRLDWRCSACEAPCEHAGAGSKSGESYCSCPDFRKNTLGTCKHILQALEKMRRRLPESARNKPYRQRNIAVHLSYGKEIELRLLLPERLDDGAGAIVRPIRGRPITDLSDLLRRIRRLQARGLDVTVYPDAEEFIQTRLLQQRIAATVADICSRVGALGAG